MTSLYEMGGKIRFNQSSIQSKWKGNKFVLFVYLGYFVPLENFSLVWKRHHCRWKAANFDLCSALMAIQQWGFFSVPHLLWHGASVYNGHLRWPVTLTPIAERLAVELSLPVFTAKVCCGWDSNTQPSACKENALTYCATAVAIGNNWGIFFLHLISYDLVLKSYDYWFLW